MSGPDVFRLEPLGSPFPAGPSVLHHEPLPVIEPQFALPVLDEYGPGLERLVSGLDHVQHAKYLPDTPVKSSRKGKEKAEDGQGGPIGQANGTRADLWHTILSREGERGHTFEPLKTWDVRQNAKAESPIGSLISDGTSNLFESLCLSRQTPISIRKLSDSNTALPRNSKALLQAMLESMMGSAVTESVWWNPARNKFEVKVGTRMSGVDPQAAKSLFDLYLNIGTAVRRLEIFLDGHRTAPLTPTHHALFHAISSILTYLKDQLSTSMESSRRSEQAEWLKSSNALQDVYAQLLILCDTVCWPIDSSDAVPLPSRASQLLSHSYAHLLSSLSVIGTSAPGTSSSLILAYILDQSSGPFFDLLGRWLGVGGTRKSDDELDPNSQPWSDLSITRSRLNEIEDGRARWSYEFEHRKMPSFIAKETSKTLFEAGRSLRQLREATNGRHPLCSGSWDLRTGWGWGAVRSTTSSESISAHTRRVHREVTIWRRSVMGSSKTPSESPTKPVWRSAKKERKRLPSEFMSPGAVTGSRQEGESPSETVNEVEDRALSFLTLVNQSPGSHMKTKDSGDSLWTSTTRSDLKTILRHHTSHALLPPDSPTLPSYVTSHVLAPLLAHAKLISTNLVTVYLEDLDLLDHLDVLRSFFLAGDCGFTERVGAALFGKEEAGAGEALGEGRRARTRARMGLESGSKSTESHGQGDRRASEWGIGLGLGLSERNQWPPGGSDLAYALRTTLLNDVVHLGGGPVWEGIEDRVSFAVKDLPMTNDGHRARWMDPQAIEALDFLYLSYSPPPIIRHLLPSSLMTKYQLLNNFLLRLARIDMVLRSMYINTAHPRSLKQFAPKVGVDLSAKPPKSVNGEPVMLASVFPDHPRVGHLLHCLRYRMTVFVTVLTRYIIDTAIGAKWDAMRNRIRRLKRPSGVLSSSRSATPSADVFDSGGLHSDRISVEDAIDDDSGAETESPGLIQLQSIESLVTYHQLTMDRILRASLLSPTSNGQRMTFKVLMGLFKLILDLGKTVKEAELQSLNEERAIEAVSAVGVQWDKQEAVFLHALERLSLRTVNREVEPEMEEVEQIQDMELLSGSDIGEKGQGRRSGSSNDLAELLIRLRLGGPEMSRRPRYASNL